jgi:hypothetical protein
MAITRCANIGHIENVNNPCFDEVCEVKKNEWEAKVPANVEFSEPNCLSSEDTVKFLAQARINVPIEEKRRRPAL